MQNIYKILGLVDLPKGVRRYTHLLIEKECKTCKTIKPIDQFRSHKRASSLGDFTLLIEPNCKDCEKINNKKSYDENIELYRKRGREFNRNNRGDCINKRNRKKYNTSPLYKLRVRISSQITQALKKNSSSKITYLV